ncbi:hypothetical protein RRG08_036976 [Elysia crispata]|uniref:Uncharacterized protein n=1 Tax=Elysia crispata TaxID=231223 RepID=A0AAE1CLU9_9GAST|nr:hypothetical protein RRG08_036976 [Elysia crispata]
MLSSALCILGVDPCRGISLVHQYRGHVHCPHIRMIIQSQGKDCIPQDSDVDLLQQMSATKGVSRAREAMPLEEGRKRA